LSTRKKKESKKEKGNPMIEDLLTKSSMDEDLLTRIQRETHERLRELRGAVDEHDRLQADLIVLDIPPEPPVDPEPTVVLKAVPEPPAAPEPSANVVRLPARPRMPRTRMVSPKITRLMRTPRRPALERAGVVRVGAGRLDSFAEVPVDELDVEAEVYERSL
jgi:hypothetical protein